MFITFEGIDGCGKTTQSKMFFEHLKKTNIKAYLTREPNGTALGAKIRKIFLKQKYSNNTSTLLLCAARSDHIEKIILPKLLKQYTVISDRFVDSTAAYQTINLENISTSLNINKLAEIKKIYSLHNSIFKIMPDITFFIDISLENIQQNLIKRSNDEVLNKLDLLPITKKQEIINNYQIINSLYANRIININGNDTIENVHKNIIAVWNKILQNKIM